MNNTASKIFSYTLIAFSIACSFSCEGNFKDVSKIYRREFVPVSEAETINLKYTDSGTVKIILKSAKMLDYSNVRFPYTEFPEGLHLIAYDEKGNISNIYANYGISYPKTDIIDLRNKVKIVTHDNKILETEQLYYNRKDEWFFTDEKCKFSNQNGDFSYFQGFDCSKDFKIINAHALMGQANIND